MKVSYGDPSKRPEVFCKLERLARAAMRADVAVEPLKRELHQASISDHVAYDPVQFASQPVISLPHTHSDSEPKDVALSEAGPGQGKMLVSGLGGDRLETNRRVHHAIDAS